eukprot:5368279-Ditylum_brightwellii.AAC.1
MNLGPWFLMEGPLYYMVITRKHLVTSLTPHANLPMHKSLPILGTLSKYVNLMDTSCSENNHVVKASAKTTTDKRESCRYGDQYMELQHVSMPKIDHKLVGKKIKMLFEMIDPNDKRVLQWYEGDVIAVSKVVIM